jgi:hypothetical protein
MKDLREASKSLNEALEDKIKLNMNKEKTLEEFIAGIDITTAQNTPDIAIDFYNIIFADEFIEDEEKEQERIEEAELDPELHPEFDPEYDYDKEEDETEEETIVEQELCITPDSKRSLFYKAIQEKPLTMKEVKELPWNDKGTTFYEWFTILERKGLASKNEEGKMVGI